MNYIFYIIIILILFVISMNYYKKIRRQRYKPYLGEIKALKRRLQKDKYEKSLFIPSLILEGEKSGYDFKEEGTKGSGYYWKNTNGEREEKLSVINKLDERSVLQEMIHKLEEKRYKDKKKEKNFIERFIDTFFTTSYKTNYMTEDELKMKHFREYYG